jgi:serine/arginine repetitive matrix protein 2
MQNFKTASQKLAEGIKTSWHTGPTGDVSNVRTSDAVMNSSLKPTGRRESTSSMVQRPESQNSINFSYPGRLRAHSPAASPAVEKGSPQSNRSAVSRGTRDSVASSSTGKSELALVYDPNSRRMVPKAELEAVEYPARDTSEHAPRKKKSSNSVRRPGKYSSRETLSRGWTTIMEPGEQLREVPDQTLPIVETPYLIKEAEEAKPVGIDDELREDTRPRDRSPGPQGSISSAASISSTEAQEPKFFKSSRADTARQPSVVDEESETDLDDVVPAFIPSREVLDALDKVPTRQTPYQPDQESDQDPATQSESRPTRYEASWGHRQGHAQPVIQTPHQEGQVVIENKHVAALARDESLPRRSTSQSPARQARFSAAPAGSLAVKHTPLPRSASPMKSALKQSSPSPRDASPADPNGQGATPDQETPVPRKKAVRVSFDERSPVIVGESTPISDGRDSPVAPSPQQTRRPWYSNLGRSKKKEYALEDDEVMKPRPALPSFGSVREKKLREPEEPERPLIRPHDPPPTPPSPQTKRAYSPSSRQETQDSKTEPATLGKLNDHAIGAALFPDQSARNAANISRFREPLPPVVTSVEGGGDFSDSMKSSDDEDDVSDIAGDKSDEDIATMVPEPWADAQHSSADLAERAVPEPEEREDPEQWREMPLANEVHSITVIEPIDISALGVGLAARGPPTPRFDVPGMFPDDVSDGNQKSQSQTTSGPALVAASAADAMKEPEAAVSPAQVSSLPQTTLATTAQFTAAQSDTDGESNESVYSDAYEDFSDGDANGFQSLNAVVESPVSKSAKAAQVLEEVSGEKARPEEMKAVTRLAASGSPKKESDWEQVKSFWRGLTAEKRRQLEQEAMEDSGADGDEEETQAPPRRPSNRTKKAAEKKPAASTAQVAKAQKAAPAAKPRLPKPSDPERTYMIQPGSKANHGPLSPARPTGRMRTSMRGEPPAKTEAASNGAAGHGRMRKSMRSDGSNDNGPPRRASLPTDLDVSPMTKKPQKVIRPDRHAQSVLKKASFDAAPTVAASSRTGLERRGSDASDSSFKRTRAAPLDGFSFRQTMRKAPPQQTSSKDTKSSRFSLRSISPTSAPFRRGDTAAPPVAMSMRRTLREGSISSQESRRLSWQFPSLGRSSKSSEKKSRASRFDGSSGDENEPNPTFRSRFDDSSNEEEARPTSPSSPRSKGTLRVSTTAPPASTIVKTATPVPEEDEEGQESEQLPDSDDDPSMHMPSPLQSPRMKTHAFRPGMPHQTSSGIGTMTLKHQRSGRGTLAPSATTPLSTTGTANDRSSFMSSILRRNKTSSGKITRSELMDSAARRDTKFERTTDQLRETRRPSSRGGAGVSSPKLQKRSSAPMPQDNNRFDFPSAAAATEVDEDDNDGRPSTAGGRINGNAGAGSRPGGPFAQRRSISLGIPSSMFRGDAPETSPTDYADPNNTIKKKKFSKLRRMFKLDN